MASDSINRELNKIPWYKKNNKSQNKHWKYVKRQYSYNVVQTISQSLKKFLSYNLLYNLFYNLNLKIYPFYKILLCPINKQIILKESIWKIIKFSKDSFIIYTSTENSGFRDTLSVR